MTADAALNGQSSGLAGYGYLAQDAPSHLWPNLLLVEKLHQAGERGQHPPIVFS